MLFQTQFKAHHKIHPGFGLAAECVDDGLAFLQGEPIGLKDVRNLLGFRIWDSFDFSVLAEDFLLVVLGITAGSKKPTKAHGNGTGGDFGEVGNNNHMRGRDGTGKSCSQCKRNGKTVGHANDNVAYEFTAGEVKFGVGS